MPTILHIGSDKTIIGILVELEGTYNAIIAKTKNIQEAETMLTQVRVDGILTELSDSTKPEAYKSLADENATKLVFYGELQFRKQAESLNTPYFNQSDPNALTTIVKTFELKKPQTSE